MISKHIAYSEISEILSPCEYVEMCGLRFTGVTPVFELIVCYRVPGNILSQAEWDSIVQNVKINTNSILVGDFNSHHVNWNCKYTDTNGKRFEKAIENAELFLHNVDSVTFMQPRRDYKSNLDLVFSNLCVSEKLNVCVNNETWGFDHFPIYINVNVKKSLYEKNV